MHLRKLWQVEGGHCECSWLPPLSPSAPPPLALRNPSIFWGLSPRLGEPQATLSRWYVKSGDTLVAVFAGSVHAGLARDFGRLTAALEPPSRVCRTIAPLGWSVSSAPPAVVKWGDEEESCPAPALPFGGMGGGVMKMLSVSRTRGVSERNGLARALLLIWYSEHTSPATDLASWRLCRFILPSFSLFFIRVPATGGLVRKFVVDRYIFCLHDTLPSMFRACRTTHNSLRRSGMFGIPRSAWRWFGHTAKAK